MQVLHSHLKLVANGSAGRSSPELQARLAAPHPATKQSPAAHLAWEVATTAGPWEGGIGVTSSRQRAAAHIGAGSTSTSTLQFL